MSNVTRRQASRWRLPEVVALGTMHGKAAAIAPAMARLGMTVVVPDDLDTDRFGTFSGEVKRTGTMRDAARAKALAAAELASLSVGIGSEGTYGAHPLLPFGALGHELLVLVDRRTGRDLVLEAQDPSPNYAQAQVRTADDMEAFMERIGFPATAIMAFDGQGARLLAKGVQRRAILDELVSATDPMCSDPLLLVTDMRAHLHPRRMSRIALLGEALAARLMQHCGACGAPGWGLIRREYGLPCAECGTATGLVRVEIEGCWQCGAERSRARADGKVAADPGQCPACNP